MRINLPFQFNRVAMAKSVLIALVSALTTGLTLASPDKNQAGDDSLSSSSHLSIPREPSTYARLSQSNWSRYNPRIALSGLSNSASNEGIDPLRFTIVGSSALSTMGASYVFLQTTWWRDQSTGFHFDNGQDLRYALNLDKLGHFYGGAFAADVFLRGLRWAHCSEDEAFFYGALFGTVVQVGIEMKDAYAPHWGFSIWDVGMGTLGSLYPWAKARIPLFSHFDLKLSYYRRSEIYFETSKTGVWNDDYVNQTYWISLKPATFLPSMMRNFWPDFLCIAMGVGVDDKTDFTGKGNVETYLALDYDVTRLFPSRNPRWERFKYYANMFKFPAPAVRFTPNTVWYGLYF